MVFWVSHLFKGIGVSVLFAGLVSACAGGVPVAKGMPDGQSPTIANKNMLPQHEDLFQQSRTAERYVLGGQVYYEFIAPCCDRFNPMFDAYGKYICAPSGGYAGRGDGGCPAVLIEALQKAKRTTVPNPFYRP